MIKTKLNKIDIAILVITLSIAAGILLFWIGWYMGLLANNYAVPSAMQFTLEKYEQAFVSSDIWTVLLLILSAAGMLRGRKTGRFFAGLAGASLLYLAGMDVTFLIQNNLYRYLPIEIGINVICVLSGISLIIYAYKS